MPQIIANNVLINYVDTGGNKPILICVHGWMHDTTSFTELTAHLKKRYRVIALDLPNFGKSQQTTMVTTLTEYAHFLSGLIDKLKIKDYVLVGHSMGGQIAILGVGNGTLRPRKLVLIASSGIRRSTLSQKILRALSIIFGPVTPSKLKDKVYTNLGSDYNSNLSPILKDVIKNVLSTDVSADAKKIRIPTLLIYGDKDTSTPIWMGEELANQISGAQLSVINNQDHWVHQNQPKEVSTIMEKFFDE